MELGGLWGGDPRESWGQGVVNEYSQNILDKCIKLSTDE